MANIKRTSLITLMDIATSGLPDDEYKEKWSLEISSKSSRYIKSIVTKAQMIGIRLAQTRGMAANIDMDNSVIHIFVESDPCVNVENLNHLFSYIQFRSIDISKFEIENLTDLSRWFLGCYKLKEVKFNRNTDFSRVKSVYKMFADCTELRKVDLSFANFDSLENADMAFFNCSKLESVSVNRSFRPYSADGIFDLCGHRHELALEMSRNTGIVLAI